MPARRVLFAPNNYYHVYNRGSEKRSIFQNARDNQHFLHRMKTNAEKYAIDVLCYCFMPNHFHFLLLQQSDISIATFMTTLQLGHAKYFNTKYTRVGPLFQGRFKAKDIESESYLLQLSAYIHRNPIAILPDIQRLHEYPYSSYSEYLRPVGKTFSKPSTILSYFSQERPDMSYKTFVENFTPDYEEIASVILDE